MFCNNFSGNCEVWILVAACALDRDDGSVVFDVLVEVDRQNVIAKGFRYHREQNRADGLRKKIESADD